MNAIVREEAQTGPATAKLTGMQADPDRYDIPYSELRSVQIEALNERFQDRKDRIKLLSLRAEQAGVTEVRDIADIVGLLLPHTAYKSYPENWLREGRWDRLTKWLGTVSSYPMRLTDTADIKDIDDWVAKLDAAGHYLSCSSGTTGKPAMLIATRADMAWTTRETLNIFSWSTGLKPNQDRLMVGVAPVADQPRAKFGSPAQKAAWGHPDWEPFRYPVPPITVGSLTKMVVLRRAIAEGTAKPGEIAEYEQTSKERQDAIDAAVGVTADYLIANREKKLYLSGLWNGHYQVAKAVRDKGYSGKDFNADNCMYVGGGLKRAQLPPDYQDFVNDTYNIQADRRHFQNYSMQELHSGMPKCREGGRYHVPPWLVPMVLNKDGDALLPHDGKGEIEGRAAFFDLSIDGRWGGVITGDKVSLTFEPCACGQRGPSIRDNVVRYADIEGDDKIGCAGTIDAYVRGMS